MAESQGRHLGHYGGWRPVGQEVEGVPQEDALQVGDCLYPGDVADDLRLGHDDAGVRDGQTIKEVHQDDNNQEDEGDQEGEGDPGETRRGIDGDVRELQLSNKHSGGLHQAGPRSVKVNVVVVVRLESRHVLGLICQNW